MKVSNNGIALIKLFEGLELESYQDIAGVWTIGYGHTETAGPNQRISEREAEDLLRRDLGPRERAVEQLVSVALNQNEFDALVSLVFNIGATAFRNSTARRRLNRNDRIGAADAIGWWNKATISGVLREVRGLTRRRAAEKALFLSPVNPPIVRTSENVVENSRVTPTEESPRRENLGESRTIQGATVAGGAGAAASTIGGDSAKELDQIETNIEDGAGLTEKPTDQGGLGDVATAGVAPGAREDCATADAAPDAASSSVDGSTSAAPETGAGDDAGAGPPDCPPADGEASGGAAVEGAGAAPAGDAVASDEGDLGPVAGDAGASDAGASDSAGAMTQSIAVGSDRPSKHEKHAVDAQLQFALLVIIILSALYVVFARIDDWFRFRR